MRGYDKHALDHRLLLDLPMREAAGGAGDYVFDRARPHHRLELHGATIGWTQLPSGLYVLDLTPGTPDFLDCPAGDTADLDFTTGAFSLGVWANADNIAAAHRIIMCRGVLNTDGWYCRIETDGSISLRTNQAGGSQVSLSATGIITPGTWYLVGFSRDGTSVRTFVNGVDLTETAASHTDPDSATRELHVGIYHDEASDPWDGQMWRPRIWGNRFLQEWEWLELFNMERHWFGV